MTTPIPTEIKFRKESRCLDVTFSDEFQCSLPWEYLRVFSPSAEVRGHSPSQAVLQLDKQDVKIVRIEPVGQYALKLEFDDGHNSGLFSWSYLYDLGRQQAKNWANYLAKLEQAGHTYAASSTQSSRPSSASSKCET